RHFLLMLLHAVLSAVLPRLAPPTLSPYTTLFRSGRRRPAGLHHPPGPRLQQLLAGVGPHPVRRRRLQRAVPAEAIPRRGAQHRGDRKSTRLNSSHVSISYAVFCLKKNNRNTKHET